MSKDVIPEAKRVGASRRGGNVFRPSQAPSGLRIANNLPGRYPVESWRAYYWAVAGNSHPDDLSITIQLPQGYADACPAVAWGEQGCIYHVRRWGLACRPSLLEEAGFAPSPLASPEVPASVFLRVYLEATHFDLPGGFVIADPDFPLLLFEPNGDLRGRCTTGISHLGALAWIATNGRIAADFQRLRREAPQFYYLAVEQFSRALNNG
jgi:hypothetical protein